MAVSHPPDALGRLFCPRRTVRDREEGAGKAPACGTKIRMAWARLSFLQMADSREVRTRGRTCAEFSLGLQTSISRYPHDVELRGCKRRAPGLHSGRGSWLPRARSRLNTDGEPS